ncbi:MAG: ATP-binding cassette domain-containing protein, partial [Prolixibacteraceae bacterium]|nr:ATP-binding cassette domain-containing protein [Prolixibacteraceae bacterium]
NIVKYYDKLLVLNNIDLDVSKGERIAFVGRNGEGKTTLARIIMSELEYQGEMKLGHNVKIGYFAQNQAQLLDNNLTVFEIIDKIAVGDIRTRIRDILAAFLFRGDDIDKKVSVLSGGERSRLAMIRLLLEPVNFLVLDEPTNHLDIHSKEILKQALINFDGTILLVSHDREFLNGLATCVYEFRDKKVKQHLGGIYDFLQKKKMDSLRELEARQKSTALPVDITGTTDNSDTKLEVSFENRKNINKQIARLEKSISSIEEKITNLERKIVEIDNQLANPEKISDNNFFEHYEDLKNELSMTLIFWENENNELEKWMSKKTW